MLDTNLKNTLRVVLFMNEETEIEVVLNWLRRIKKHVFALESDSGGFSPRGFSLECNDANFERISSWKYLFEPYYVHSL
jgi:hypothetical protein